MTVYDKIERAVGQRPGAIATLTGGAVGEVYRVDLPDGQRLVAKVTDDANATLSLEGYMLRYLREHSNLPVPEVIYDGMDDLLVMTFIEGSSEYSPDAQAHAAELVADLHTIRADRYGFERDTLLGLLPLDNTWSDSWLAFFRDRRLLAVTRDGVERGFLPAEVLPRVDKLAAQLDTWFQEPNPPSLIHGDIWRTNILAQDGRITALIDPAIYFADPEIELAYMVWNEAFEPVFWERYKEIHPINPGFYEARCDIYSLYWKLVNAWHFPSEKQYMEQADSVLTRFSC